MGYEAIRSEGHDGRLVLTSHGTGGSAGQLRGAAEQLFPYAHIVSAFGDVVEDRQRSFVARAAGGGCDRADLATRREAMAGFVVAETARTGAREIIGIGYSSGASLLAAISVTAPDLFDTLALMPPLFGAHPAPRPGLAATRVLIAAGRHGPIISAATTQALSDWYAAQMADVTLAWHSGGHEVSESAVAALAAFLA